MEEEIKKTWEDNLHCEIADVHECERLVDNVLVFQDPEDQEYYLGTVWLADEEDAEHDSSISVGECLSSCILPISYCPFCGEKLIK